MAILVRRHRRLELAEDAVAGAFERAARRWRVDGIPANPPGWLLTVAGRIATDALRTETVVVRKAPLLVVGEDDVDMIDRVTDHRLGSDDLLRLVFGICHPVLTMESQAALALRLVLGVPTADVARLFLVSEPTMAARLTRARKRLAAGAVPFSVPGPDEFDERVEGVLRATYLAFTAGYAPTSGSDVHRPELAGEAVRLGRILLDLLPRRADVRALVALMTLQHARRDARTDRHGRVVVLPDQDRRRWRRDEIGFGLALAADLRPTTGYAEELRLQALIAGVHAAAPTAAATGWDVIASLYEDLEELTGSPVVRLNRAVAVAEALGAEAGPRAGLALLDGLEDLLPRHHRLPATQAELLRRSGDVTAAEAAYRRAIDLCGNARERDHLEERLATLREPM